MRPRSIAAVACVIRGEATLRENPVLVQYSNLSTDWIDCTPTRISEWRSAIFTSCFAASDDLRRPYSHCPKVRGGAPSTTIHDPTVLLIRHERFAPNMGSWYSRPCASLPGGHCGTSGSDIQRPRVPWRHGTRRSHTPIGPLPRQSKRTFVQPASCRVIGLSSTWRGISTGSS